MRYHLGMPDPTDFRAALELLASRGLAPAPAPASRGRMDGWYSALTGIGTTTYDKSISGRFLADVVDNATAGELWRGDDLAARIIELLPHDMLREGFELRIADADEAIDTKALSELISGKWEDLGFVPALLEALNYERAYGGAAIMMGVNDGTRDLSLPLNMDSIASVDWLTTLEPREVHPLYYYGDPRAPKFGLPEIYQITPDNPGMTKDGSTAPQTVLVHETRLIVFGGVRVSRRQLSASLPGWGDSILTRVQSVLRNFNMSWSSAGILVQDFAQAVFKMKGLAELVGLNNQDGDNTVKARMRAVELSRSTARAVLIDAEEEFERKQTPVSGLPELLDRFATRLAAAAGYPLELLMAQPPSGLNADGNSGLRFYYDSVKSTQIRKLLPPIERFIKILFRACGADEPPSWSVWFAPLWQPTEAEQATARKTQAETDAIYITNGVVSAEEIAINRFKSEVFSFATVIDFEAREALEPAAAGPAKTEQQIEKEKAEADAMKQSLRKPGGGPPFGGGARGGKPPFGGKG